MSIYFFPLERPECQHTFHKRFTANKIERNPFTLKVLTLKKRLNNRKYFHAEKQCCFCKSDKMKAILSREKLINNELPDIIIYMQNYNMKLKYINSRIKGIIQMNLEEMNFKNYSNKNCHPAAMYKVYQD